jgi:hypothetical protein
VGPAIHGYYSDENAEDLLGLSSTINRLMAILNHYYFCSLAQPNAVSFFLVGSQETQ